MKQSRWHTDNFSIIWVVRFREET